MPYFRTWLVFSWVRRTIFSWCLIWLLGVWLIIVYSPLEYHHIWWQLVTGYQILPLHSPLLFPGWCIIFLCSGCCQLYSLYIYRDLKGFFLLLDRQGHCSVFRSQLLTALPLAISLSFRHSSPAATSAASRQRQAMCAWPGSRAPLAVTKTTEGMSVKLFCNLKHDWLPESSWSITCNAPFQAASQLNWKFNLAWELNLSLDSCEMVLYNSIVHSFWYNRHIFFLLQLN